MTTPDDQKQPESTEPSTGSNSDITSQKNTARPHDSSAAKASTTKSKPSGGSTSAKHSQSKAPRSRRPWVSLLLGLMVLVLISALVGVSYYGNLQLEQHKQTVSDLEARLVQQIQNTQQSIANDRTGQSKQLSNLQAELKSNQQALNDMRSRITTQAKRLRAMSDTSREDWQLAEAEYLLKLANQRVLIERNAGGAEALIQEADNILRDLEDPDLHNLRRALARDLAALRLMNKVDVEGIYLNLVALAEQVDSLPLQNATTISPQKEPLADLNLTEDSAPSTRTKFLASWQRFKDNISSAYRVIPQDEIPKRVITPDARYYVQQNLRLMIERVQVALLREQQDIYQQSLTQAQTWIDKHYSLSLPVVQFREQLNTLKEKEVVLVFPDISGSLTMLHEYIDTMHKLKDIELSTQKDSNDRAGVSQ